MNKYLPQNGSNGWISPITLIGNHVRLEPISMQHCADLKEATQDGELWKIWYVRVPSPDDMEGLIKQRIALQNSGEMFTFAVIDNKNNKAVGMTSYFKIISSNKRLDIGYTWYRKSVQRTPINTETKLLLLDHAFRVLGAIAVGFGANWFNIKSRKAIERLGAKLDGVLRNHMILPNGVIADYCLYSITQDEWQAVNIHLKSKLQGDY